MIMHVLLRVYVQPLHFTLIRHVMYNDVIITIRWSVDTFNLNLVLFQNSMLSVIRPKGDAF